MISACNVKQFFISYFSASFLNFLIFFLIGFLFIIFRKFQIIFIIAIDNMNNVFYDNIFDNFSENFVLSWMCLLSYLYGCLFLQEVQYNIINSTYRQCLLVRVFLIQFFICFWICSIFLVLSLILLEISFV